MKVMMVISYDGSKFHGFQRQNNEHNVQGYLERELTNVLNEKIEIKGAGRTDKGVHAFYQVVHFETNKNISYLKKKLNNKLINLKIKKVKVVNDNFHARHSVKNKTYLYKIDLSGKKNSNYYLIYKNKLNINKMKKASKLFIGSHDFHNFVAGKRDDYKSTILNIKIYKRFNTLYLKFTGIGFYRYMVRNLVGSLLEVGKGKIESNVIKDMIDKPNIEKRLPTSSPNGLYLYKINY
jgi:tRNA pseudouridine38-40 synthase